ncbi:sensor histidine kinase [Brachybacterium sp. AOP43-C2-M15]|uniref:sensor histidine kinase n=1 Tax=Brachybacterium sp. AOP43-C2-M15 TaxID=3457661 RepID=UPI004033A5FA
MRLPDLSGIQVPREPARLARRAVRQVLGTLLGLVLGPLLVLTALLLPLHVRAPFRRVRGWELLRLRRAYRVRLAQDDGHFLGGRRALLHGLAATVLGYVMFDLLLLATGVVVGSFFQSFYGSPVRFEFDFWVISRPAPAVLIVVGPACLLAAALYAEGAAWVQATLLGRWTSVVREDALESRMSSLLTTRRGVVLAIDDERRRIERDLHDGVQQNVVSLSVALARARRAEDPARSAELLGQAHRQSQDLIQEVREVAWRVYPTALDEHGLASALDVIAETCPLPVRTEVDVTMTLPSQVESAAYFVAREAVTNVVKHARASSIDLAVVAPGTTRRPTLRLTVRDDGLGGADPAGGGLQGLARRVAALDGSVEVDSPPGGPTVITMEIPCDRDS